MKRFLLLPTFVFIGFSAIASFKDSTHLFNLPDSIKAVQFMTEIKIGESSGKNNKVRAGIRTEVISLYIDNFFKKKTISFTLLTNGVRIVNGRSVSVHPKNPDISFSYDWKVNQTYRLLISHAGDSAENFSLHSGYIFLPEENKWKLIGTYRTVGSWSGIKNPATFCMIGKKYNSNVTTVQAWIQRSNGSWKNLLDKNQPPPVFNLYSHLDSLALRSMEIKRIGDSISIGKTDILYKHNGIYYTILKEGTGRPILVNDTVVAFYKGYLFANGPVFDQTKDKPATFPLNRLIKGWQIGLPLCKVGGKIKLIIPSDLAYSIRTRSAKIPPNSILVFEIEVVDAK